MPRKLTKLELMQSASIMQNPRVMPRKVGPEHLVSRAPFLESPITGAAVPESARDVAGASEGVMNRDRAAAQTPSPGGEV